MDTPTTIEAGGDAVPGTTELLAGLGGRERWGVPEREQRAVRDAERELEWHRSVPEVELGKFPRLEHELTWWRHRMAGGYAELNLGLALLAAADAYASPDLQAVAPDLPPALLEQPAAELATAVNRERGELLHRAGQLFDGAVQAFPGYALALNRVDYSLPRRSLKEIDRDVLDLMAEGKTWSLVAKAKQLEALAECRRSQIDVGGCDVSFHAGWWTGDRGLGRHPGVRDLEQVRDRLDRLRGGTKPQVRRLANAEVAVLIQCARVNEEFEWESVASRRNIRLLEAWVDRPELTADNRRAVAGIVLAAHESIRAAEDREADDRRRKIDRLKDVVTG